MNSVKSFYLELLRVFAAFYVFIYHVGSETIDNKQYLSNNKYTSFLNLKYSTAHFFVMIFFVLSGYLITMSASKPKLTFKSFITFRLGRLYSVLIPALVFSFTVEFFFKLFNYSIISKIDNISFPLLRFILNLFFLGQIGSFCSTPPFNGAFWSVQYEFIYYVVLGVVLLIRKPYKYFILFLILSLSWLKILLLLPVWLAGACLYYFQNKFILNKYISLLLFTTTSFFLIYCLFINDSFPFQKSTNENVLFGYVLFFSWNFLADYLFALIVFFNLYSFFQLSDSLIHGFDKSRMFLFLYKKIKIIGNCSYTLYLFHTPLLFLFATIFPYNRFNNYHILALILLVLITVFFIARLTEWKISFWRNIVSDCIEVLLKSVKKIKSPSV